MKLGYFGTPKQLKLATLNSTLETNVTFNEHTEKYFFNPSSQKYQDSILMSKRVAKHGNTEAFENYNLASKLSNPKYQCLLGRLYEDEELVHNSLLETLKRYTEARVQGYNNIRPKLYAMDEDKPYEELFFQKLFQNLLIASRGYFRLNGLWMHFH
ncbi:hypothetical protein K501DRAFT_270857 [Backusella circina FSU 941]|nr:hypothetical protein K501DRAFT_270857 [Backusella circina FSU 941]